MLAVKMYECSYNSYDYLDIDESELQLKLQARAEMNPDFIFRSSGVSSFELTKRRIMRDSFNPVFFGQIIKNSNSLQIEGKFGYDIEVTAIVICTYLMLFILALGSYTMNGLNTQLLFGLGCLIFLIAFQWIGNRLSIKKQQEIIKFIEMICCNTMTLKN